MNEFEDAINHNVQIGLDDSVQLHQNKIEPLRLKQRLDEQAARQPQKTGSHSKSQEPARSNFGKRSIGFSMQLQKEDICSVDERIEVKKNPLFCNSPDQSVEK